MLSAVSMVVDTDEGKRGRAKGAYPLEGWNGLRIAEDG
jgi:hypothetical protein